MKTENPQHHLQDTTEVLIALASQESEPSEQPPSPEELTDFFAHSRHFPEQRQDEILAYLDSNPQAYDQWIRQGKQAAQSKRASLIVSIIPYAIATGMALLSIGVFMLLRGQAFELDQAIDRAYQTAVSSDDPESFQRATMSLMDSPEPSGQLLSFSQAEQPSQVAQAFILGLQQDGLKSHKMLPGNVQKEDYLLGRWHTLLWTITQQKAVLPTGFWKEQVSIRNHLQAHYSNRSREQTKPEINAIVVQLERMQPALQTLAENNQAIQTYKNLEQTLAALRYGLMHAESL